MFIYACEGLLKIDDLTRSIPSCVMNDHVIVDIYFTSWIAIICNKLLFYTILCAPFSQDMICNESLLRVKVWNNYFIMSFFCEFSRHQSPVYIYMSDYIHTDASQLKIYTLVGAFIFLINFRQFRDNWGTLGLIHIFQDVSEKILSTLIRRFYQCDLIFYILSFGHFWF